MDVLRIGVDIFPPFVNPCVLGSTELIDLHGSCTHHHAGSGPNVDLFDSVSSFLGYHKVHYRDYSNHDNFRGACSHNHSKNLLYDLKCGFLDASAVMTYIKNPEIVQQFDLSFANTATLVLVVPRISISDDAMMFVARNPWMYYVSYVAFLVVYIALACCRSVRRSFPANLICLIILTLSIAYMTAMITAFHKTSIVFAAMGICALVTLSISLFACNTKYDFTSWVGVMFVVFMVVFFFGIFAIIFSYMKPEYGGILMAVYGGLMALVFMVYLAIDTQMIIGGKKHEMSEEEHIFAAVQLFLDIIYIFWFLLSIMGFVSGGD